MNYFVVQHYKQNYWKMKFIPRLFDFVFDLDLFLSRILIIYLSIVLVIAIVKI